jgi:DNA-binding HxlR family transcriptional regulator
MSIKFRCDCPVTSAIDVLGDKWMLVIVKQMILDHSQTFKDFIESSEGIATNILSTKLKMLEEIGVVKKSKLPHNKKTNLYHLTESGLALIPVISELILWSDGHLRGIHPIIQEGEGMIQLRSNKQAFLQYLEESYKKMVSEVVNS